MKGFPVGLRFHPKDTELVSYLRNKAKLGDGFRSPFILDCPDFSGKWEPWTIWDKYGGNSDVEDGEPLFFFTKRITKGTRFDRKVGSGTWSGQNLIKIVDKGKVVGSKRDFRYEGGRSEDQNNAWLMTEYELNNDDVTVLCVLRKSPTNPPPKTQRKLKDDSKGKRKMKDLDQIREPTGDLDQRTKLRMKKPKMEETSCEEIRGCGTIDLHPEEYPELVSDLAADDDFVFSTHDLLAATTDDSNHGE